MEEYIRNMVEPILARPQELQIIRSKDERGVLLTISISKHDMGRVIGKEGNTIKAIRLLAHIYGTMHNAVVSVKVQEPGEQPPPYTATDTTVITVSSDIGTGTTTTYWSGGSGGGTYKT